MVVVGAYVGLSKLLLAAFPVLLLAWLRFAIAAVAMIGWLAPGAGDVTLSAADRRLVFACSFVGNFLFTLCMLYGVALSSAVAAGVIMAAIPAAVALLSRVFLGEQLARRTLAGVGCAVAGIALLSMERHAGSTPATNAWFGNLLLAMAMLCEASYVVIGKRLMGVMSPRRISALINLWGLALTTPLGLWAALSFDFASVGHATWGLLCFYAIAASMLSVWLWMTGLKRVPSAVAGVFTVFLPISAASVGVLVLGEPFTAFQAAAVLFALLGVSLASLGPPAAARAITAPAGASGRSRT
jgi:drug/metabolite transporter (DMT)-like permease